MTPSVQELQRAKFIGAKTVNIPTVGMSGLGDYDRDTGFARGGVSVTHQPFTLTQDRGVSFQIDAQDADESGIPGIRYFSCGWCIACHCR